MPIEAIPEFDLADYLAGCANALFGYRVAHDDTLSKGDWDALRQTEHDLLKAVVRLRAEGVGRLADLADDSKAAVAGALDSMNAFIKKIADARKAIAVATAAIGLAGAFFAGGPVGIVTAAMALEEAAK